jgi:hypothetical protein
MALRRYAGAFFPGATGFTIGGSDFTSNVTNNIYNPLPEQPAGIFSYCQYLRVTYGGYLPAFRRIPLGDINLLKVIRMNNESGVVGRQSQRTDAQQMYYSAKVVGGEPGPMTVAMYQGDDMEEVSVHETPHTLLER